MKHDNALSPEIYQHALEFLRVGNEAVRKAREENRRLGIPNASAVNGHLCWELPNGEITLKDPDAEDRED